MNIYEHMWRLPGGWNDATREGRDESTSKAMGRFTEWAVSVDADSTVRDTDPSRHFHFVLLVTNNNIEINRPTWGQRQQKDKVIEQIKFWYQTRQHNIQGLLRGKGLAELSTMKISLTLVLVVSLMTAFASGFPDIKLSSLKFIGFAPANINRPNQKPTRNFKTEQECINYCVPPTAYKYSIEGNPEWCYCVPTWWTFHRIERCGTGYGLGIPGVTSK